MARKTGSRTSSSGRGLVERVEWVVGCLSEFGDGVHRLGGPARVLDSALPDAVAGVCREFDGAEMFHETIVLFAGAEIRSEEGRFHVGDCGGDAIYVDSQGAVWRFDSDIEELLADGTRFDRWLAGIVDAESVLYDKEGEFLEGVFDEEGELSDNAEAERARRQLKRDPKAVAPRWRLARALVSAGKGEAARRVLEDVVEAESDFPWAWFDLARISEKLGEAEVASEEAERAAKVRTGYAYSSFFLAHAARLAQLAGLDARAQKLADEVLEEAPELPRSHVEAARECLESGDTQAARELLVLARVVAPRDLQVIDLLSQIEN
ncbi:MAG: tetratricopeptide repeat protein [Myxococcales bacterium]|nr:tetratricopeptide repeat protein [Myxococcales bacterium]